MVLYRPVGHREYELIRDRGFASFPPRLLTQPIFYPVLNIEYARQIASEWNATDPSSGYRGYVLRFVVEDAYLARFEVKTVGASRHQEYWIPADELEEFNRHIVGCIDAVEEYSG